MSNIKKEKSTGKKKDRKNKTKNCIYESTLTQDEPTVICRQTLGSRKAQSQQCNRF